MRIKAIILAPLAVIFLAFGILMLITAYQQDHPITFLALFFSSSMIVLLSLTCLIALIWRKFSPTPPLEEEEDENEAA